MSNLITGYLELRCAVTDTILYTRISFLFLLVLILPIEGKRLR